MSKSYSDDTVANPSSNSHITAVAAARISRRGLLKAAGALSALSVLPLAGCASVREHTRLYRDSHIHRRHGTRPAGLYGGAIL